MASRFGFASLIPPGLEVDSVEGGEDALVVTARSNARTAGHLQEPRGLTRLLIHSGRQLEAQSMGQQPGFFDVVVEDYVHGAGTKVLSLLLLRFLYVLFGGASIFAILRVAFGS